MGLTGGGNIGNKLGGTGTKQLPENISTIIADLIWVLDKTSDDDVSYTFSSITGTYDAGNVSTTNVSSVTVYKNNTIQTATFSLSNGDTLRVDITRNDNTKDSTVTLSAV